MTIPRELAEWHLLGAVLVGAIVPPGDFDAGADLADARLRWVLDAVKIAHGATGQWPLDLRVVADVLRSLGELDRIGGVPLLLELIESWSERETRARKLGLVGAVLRLADARVAQQAHAERALVGALCRFEGSKEKANAAIALLEEACS